MPDCPKIENLYGATPPEITSSLTVAPFIQSVPIINEPKSKNGGVSILCFELLYSHPFASTIVI
ncbi:hypothetical protein D3C72_648400 [compost metagenome]